MRNRKQRDSILGAKLFGIAALVVGVLAFVPFRWTNGPFLFDFYLHDTYFVVAPAHAIFGFALLCVLFAGFYYLGDRASARRMNSVLSLAHFLLWIFALVVSWAEERALIRAALRGQDLNQSRLILAGSAAVALAFLAGGLLFLINFVWAFARRSQTS